MNGEIRAHSVENCDVRLLSLCMFLKSVITWFVNARKFCME